MKVKQTYSPEEKARMVLEGLTYPDHKVSMGEKLC